MSETGAASGQLHLWMGPDFGREGDVRLLVVAPPSVRGRGDLRQVGVGLEARATGDYVSGKLKHVQFTAVARLVIGRPAPREECEAFWQRVAFLDEPAALMADLERLHPDALLVLGAEAWAAIPAGEPEGQLDEAPDEPWGARRLLHHAAGPCLAVCAPHPGSSGFAFRDHTAQVRAAIEAAAGPRASF